MAQWRNGINIQWQWQYNGINVAMAANPYEMNNINQLMTMTKRQVNAILISWPRKYKHLNIIA